MEQVKANILESIHLLKNSQNSVNAMMAKELASIATRYFAGDRDYVNIITNIVTGRLDNAIEIAAGKTAQGATKSKWSTEWNPNAEAGKRVNSGQRQQGKAAVVVDGADGHNEHSGGGDAGEGSTGDAGQDIIIEVTPISFFVGKTEQQVVEHFGGFEEAKDYCREQALPLNYRLGPAKFLAEFLEYVAEGAVAYTKDEEE